MLSKTETIRDFLLKNVDEHPHDITSVAADHFGITRQAIARHLSKLVKEGLLHATGKTKARTYELRTLVENEFVLPLSPSPAEDVIWRESIRPLLGELQDNVLAICHHGFTEMMNNAIDHSEGTSTQISVSKNAVAVDLAIHDNGIGIFNKIARELGLSDKRHSVLELAKGKFTTDPTGHSGEGIFFTSRMFDRFMIVSEELSLWHELDHGDWLFEDQEHRSLWGTSVLMTINIDSTRNVTEVFDEFADPKDHTFSKTRVPIVLAQYGDDNLISRSQAKRVLTRFDKFKEVYLDFSGVDVIGQAFADEIFRVFQRENPDIKLLYVGANSTVEKMILRAINRGIAEGPWHRVEISGDETAVKASATALMEGFGVAYQARLSAGPPPTDVRVFHGQSTGGDHIYFFSPGASDLAQKLLRQWNADVCDQDPDLTKLKKVNL